MAVVIGAAAAVDDDYNHGGDDDHRNHCAHLCCVGMADICVAKNAVCLNLYAYPQNITSNNK